MIGGMRSAADQPFNEGVQVPEAEWRKIVKRNPALESKNIHEKTEATRHEILKGELAKFRRR